ncbi:MAG TPA: carboxymuconolactone decarboxylase family protein [Hyphomicrobiaceae bacterium]|nr:carboxymuconolactone decarboxylase family protein [Hyphomicrobiaceae bacterium]
MARLPYLDLDELALTPENQRLMVRKGNIYKALANSPKGLNAFGTLASYIRFDSKLDQRLSELAILMVGYATRQPYEWSHHVEIARRFGVKDEDIRALMEEGEGRNSKLDPLAKAVVRASKEMTENLGLLDATFAALRQGLDEELIVDLLVTIGFYNAVVRVLGALQIDVEDDYKKFLDEFPLPRGPKERPE